MCSGREIQCSLLTSLPDQDANVQWVLREFEFPYGREGRLVYKIGTRD
jgi:hypothetical protein